MKGFVITIDSIIALILSISLILIISSPLFKLRSSAWSDMQVKHLSMDSLTILEKSGILARAVEQNSSSELLYFMSTESTPLCMRIKVSGADGYTLYVEKAGCTDEKGKSFLSKRTFISGNKFYTAELHAWQR
jgi:hypothetical protein